LGESPSRLSQMLYNGRYFGLEEGAPLRVVVQGIEFLNKQWTALYPSVEGLHGGFGCAAWLVEQSQFGLAIGTDLKHVNVFLEWITVLQRYEISATPANIYCSFLPLSRHLRTSKDIGGHSRT